jgi:hypothetical protein
LGGVGGVVGQLCPDMVGGHSHKAEGTSNVVLGTLVPCLGFDVLEPVLEVSSRIGSVAREWVRVMVEVLFSDMMGGWMDGYKGLNTTVDPNLS